MFILRGFSYHVVFRNEKKYFFNQADYVLLGI